MNPKDLKPGQVIEIPYCYKVKSVEREFVFCEGVNNGNEIRLRLSELSPCRLISDPFSGWDESRVPGKRFI